MPALFDSEEYEEGNNTANSAEDKGSAWPLIVVVILTVCGIVFAVLNHSMEKPRNYQPFTATAFTRNAAITELQTGRQARPLQFEPAKTESMQWNPIYICPTHGVVGTIYYDATGRPHCPICKQVLMVKK